MQSLETAGQTDGEDQREPAPQRPVVLVVDDDPAVLNTLTFSLKVEGFAVRAYASGRELLDDPVLPVHGCLVIDQRLPGMSGLELVASLRARKVSLPAILITTTRARCCASARPTPVCRWWRSRCSATRCRAESTRRWRTTAAMDTSLARVPLALSLMRGLVPRIPISMALPCPHIEMAGTSPAMTNEPQ